MTVDDQSSVYIGGLAYDVNEEQIRDTFEKYGEIVAIKLVEDHDGRSRGYGFVTFTKPEDASNAISAVNGQEISGRPIRVNEVRKKGFRDNGSFRDRRDKDWRDRDRGSGGRYYSPRYSRRSPRRGRSPYRRRSPIYDRSRSPRSESRSSRDSYDRYEEAPKHKSKVSKAKVQEHLAKIAERKEQVTSLEDDLKRTTQALSDAQSKVQKLEAAVSSEKATAAAYAEHWKKMQRTRLNMKECKEKLVSLEKEYEGLVEIGAEQVDAAREDRFHVANGGLEETKKTED